jgi:hypothetical protein
MIIHRHDVPFTLGRVASLDSIRVLTKNPRNLHQPLFLSGPPLAPFPPTPPPPPPQRIKGCFFCVLPPINLTNSQSSVLLNRTAYVPSWHSQAIAGQILTGEERRGIPRSISNQTAFPHVYVTSDGVCGFS